MLKVLRRLASLKITLLGMGLLGIGAFLSYGNPDAVSIWVLIVPLALLAINLSCAITTNSRINQQPGLLLFHVCLLSIVILAGIGRLTHLDAHLEMAVGESFNPENLLDEKSGPLHSGAIDLVKFKQGVYTVEYEAGLQRGLTHNWVKVRNADGQWQELEIGDDRPLVLEGYRFYTTFNKGFTALVTWLPAGNTPITGTINMPSYPMFDYKQDNRWLSPDGQELKLWLQLDTGLTEDQAWILDSTKTTAKLIVTVNEQRNKLNPGDTLAVGNALFRYEGLSTWMGYRVFYDPTIHWLFFVSVVGVFGLMHYFKEKISLQPWLDEKTPEADNDPRITPADSGSRPNNRGVRKGQGLRGEHA